MVVGDDAFDSTVRQCNRDERNTNKKWRCDQWLPRPTENNYKDGLDITKLDEFEKDVRADKGKRNIEKFIDAPTGWGNGLDLEAIGLSTFIQEEIRKDRDSNLITGDCDSKHWCTRDS